MREGRVYLEPDFLPIWNARNLLIMEKGNYGHLLSTHGVFFPGNSICSRRRGRISSMSGLTRHLHFRYSASTMPFKFSVGWALCRTCLVASIGLIAVAVTLAQSTGGKDQISNGISVGRPKIFDNRTLTIMLETLSQTLSGIQFLDQKSVTAALGNLSGFSSRDFTSNLTVNTLPTPALSQQTVANTGNVDKTGGILPNNGASNTLQTTTGSTTASVTPTAPNLDTTQALAGFTPNYGPNASDLLNDQVNLQYQIFNLRMLLERSLSDRTLHAGGPRLQTVIGFNVTIDPPRRAEDSVAVVEVTVTADGTDQQMSKEDLSLVSVMPQEKTYNAAALSSKSNSFGGSAVVNVVQIGYAQRRRSQIFYLYRDTDTLSFEDMTRESQNQIVFGWAFRPVLGRRSVSPGLRQMFAIISLPQSDIDKHATLTTKVRTYWKKYDSGTLTAFQEHDAIRRSKVWYATSLGLTKPEILEKRYTNSAQFTNIEVKTTTGYEQDLTPVVTAARWRSVGPKSALVTVEGENFFSGTQIAIGDKTIASAADGLILKSSRTFDVLTTVDALANGPGMLIGRYGPAVPLLDSSQAPGVGIAIKRVEIGPELSGSRSIGIVVTSKTNAQGKMLASELPRDPLRTANKTGPTIPADPIVTVNGKVLPGPYTIVQLDDGVLVSAQLDNSILSNGGAAVKISWPFLSDAWTATKFVNDPALVFSAFRSDDKTVLITTKDLLGFNLTTAGVPGSPGFCWRIANGKDIDNLRMTGTCDRDATDHPKGTAISTHAVAYTFDNGIPDKIVLVSPNQNATFTVDVPKPDSASSSSAKPTALNQYDRVWIDIPAAKGKDFSSTTIDKVEANQISLPYQAPVFKAGDPPVTKLHVEVTQDITAKPGDVDVTVFDTKKTVLGSTKLHITCVDCKNSGVN